MHPSRAAVRRSRWMLWPTVVLVSAAIISPASYSAFNAKVSNTGNTFGVGTVALGDDDSGTALFTATGLKPGSTGTKCVAVTSTGSLASTVKLYATDAVTTKSLSSYITLTITQGTGGTFSSCSGFSALSSGSSVYNGTLAAFASSATGFGSGLGSWAPTGNGNETRTFQFGYAISSSIPDSAQGGTASLGFTWEAQNS